jgi:D-alanyl-D-alanine carboxypeptidase
MALIDFGARHGLRYCLLAIVALAAVFTISSDVADARRHHRLHAHYSHNAHATREAHATRTGHSHRHARVEEGYSPPYASIVVDGNSGAVLQATNADGSRHPASLTKVMTLYLLFERLDAGRLKLDSPLRVSEHAAEQSPTKLDLKAGQTITVEDAIKGIVTKSANDAAVAVAENLGGDEESFAKLMTQKARALGMTHTTYVNASGLPDDDQITTARDQALLGRAIQERFPNYYKYFSTESFVYRGEAMRNHNHLLGAVEGVDGIKTGFTHASGFNLLTSVHRDGRFIVGVVMGGPTSSERDERMRELIGAHLKEASLRRTAPAIAEGVVHYDEAFANSPMAKSPMAKSPIASRAEHTAAADPHIAVVGSNDPIRPVLVKTVSFRTAPVQTASLVPMPTLVRTAPPAPQPALPQLSAAPLSAGQSAAATPAAPSQATASAALHPLTEIASAVPAADVSAPQVAPASAPAAPKPHAVSTATPAVPKPQAVATSTVAVSAPAEPPPAKFVESGPAQLQPAQIEPTPAETTADVSAGSAPEQSASAISAETAHAHSGWMIQIGAFDDEDEAKQHLSDAQLKARAALAAKDPFTEKVQKGDKALYRARFAGFDKTTAEAACRTLKRSDFACLALKD